MKTIKFILLLMIFISFFMCGKTLYGSEKQNEEVLNGETLGKLISENFIEMNKELVEILKNEADLEIIEERALELKEKYIKIYVELGREKLTLSESEQKKSDRILRETFFNYDREAFDYINKRMREIWETDNSLADLIAEFNVLTQYADFDLLKRQNPDEAERLGIE